MKYALVKNGIVENVIIADQNFIDAHMGSQYDHCICVDDLTPYPGPGWLYDGQVFSAPPPEEIVTE